MTYRNDLSYEYVASILDYNPKTGDFIWKWRKDATLNWNARWAGKKAGSMDRRGYVTIGINNKYYAGHRLAWLLSTGAWPTHDIDHDNGVRNDNRIDNLRGDYVTDKEQAQNRKRRSDNKTGYTGVCYHRATGMYQATINSIYLGLYNSADEAYSAYLAAKKRHHTYKPIPRDL